MAQLATGAAHGSTAKLVRVVHRQCPNCCAPGMYTSADFVKNGYAEEQIAEMVEASPELSEKVDWFRKGWPSLWVAANDPKCNSPVGTTCPECGSSRPTEKKLQTMKIRGRLF